MSHVFISYLDKFVVVFIDDILGYFNDQVDNEEHLLLVLQTLWEHRLYAKLSKCEFWSEKLLLLAYFVSKKVFW